MDFQQPEFLKSDKKVVVYGSNNCPYCKKVSALFESKHIEFEYRNTSEDKYEQQRTALEALLKFDTVPMVFINGKFIGGCSDTQTLSDEGKLDALLN